MFRGVGSSSEFVQHIMAKTLAILLHKDQGLCHLFFFPSFQIEEWIRFRLCHGRFLEKYPMWHWMANDKGIKNPQVFMISHTPSRVSYNLFFWVKNCQKAMHTRGLWQPYCESKAQIQANSPKPFRSPLSLSLSPPSHHIGYHCWNFFHLMPHTFHVNSLTSGDINIPKIHQ
jgi:hypothetical protein